MSTVISAQSALVMNAFAAIFENNLISKDLVTWKQFDGEYGPTNRELEGVALNCLFHDVHGSELVHQHPEREFDGLRAVLEPFQRRFLL